VVIGSTNGHLESKLWVVADQLWEISGLRVYRDTMKAADAQNEDLNAYLWFHNEE